MASGWVERHRHGWRGGWRDERGRVHHTKTVYARGDANRLLYERIDAAAGRVRTIAPTFQELADRFVASHLGRPERRKQLTAGLLGPKRLFGDLRADVVTPEVITRWLAQSALSPHTQLSYLGIVRAAYRFGVDNKLVSENPALRVRSPSVRRTDRLMPFESWEEVERVAAEAGTWGSFIVFAVDTGARPGELLRLEHRHVNGNRCYLPGTKTRGARRTVTLTERGVAAYQSVPRESGVALVFHSAGEPINFGNWRRRVWAPALEIAGLPYRVPYQTRHTFAYFSLMAGVPLSDLAVEMGHSSIKLAHETYGAWSDEMGDRAAALRSDWAKSRGEKSR